MKNSKLNTGLLVLIVVLALSIIWIQWHDRKADESEDVYQSQETLQGMDEGFDVVVSNDNAGEKFYHDNGIEFGYRKEAQVMEGKGSENSFIYVSTEATKEFPESVSVYLHGLPGEFLFCVDEGTQIAAINGSTVTYCDSKGEPERMYVFRNGNKALVIHIPNFTYEQETIIDLATVKFI